MRALRWEGAELVAESRVILTRNTFHQTAMVLNGRKLLFLCQNALAVCLP
ncbi:hypothetical protein ASZ90_016358 [hydrocarbon metagenome]|uniref:Uncharacterized protein n=1 Tax=hydrocarbon metagenome TaxID=938273 RepID=A0A0W8EZ24_9ZZZZ